MIFDRNFHWHKIVNQGLEVLSQNCCTNLHKVIPLFPKKVMPSKQK